MSFFRKIISVTLACCLLFSLSAGALAATPHIESVKLTADGTYAVEGSIDGYDSSGTLYTAAYDDSGKMTAVKSDTPDTDGTWSSGVKASGGTDVLKTFVLAGNGLAPIGENDCAVAVTTMEQLAEALADNACDNIFIAKDMAISTTEANKTVGVNKTVTVSKDVTLTVPSGYTLQLNSGSRLTVAGTLDIPSGALVAVAGSYTYLNGGNTERIGSAELVIKGGTANVAGTLRVWPASTDTNENYDGGSGGIVTGTGSGGSVLVSTGNVEINGGYTNGTSGAYNNGGRMEVIGYTVSVGESGRLQNDNELFVCRDGAVTGAGTVLNNYRIRLEGGGIAGTLNLDNKHEIQAMDLYWDDGSGNITFCPASIGVNVNYGDNNGSGWIYEAAQATTGAGLLAALTEYVGENIEFSSGESLNIGGFDVPYGKSLRTFAPLNLTFGSTVRVYGSMEVYNTLNISSGASLNIAKSGNFEVQCSGGQHVSNAGSVAVYGILEVGKLNENQGSFQNTGTITIDGLLTVLPGSSLLNSGTVTGNVMLVSNADGSNAGSLTGEGSVPAPTAAIEVSSFGELVSAMSGVYGALYAVKDIEISSDTTVSKELVVPENTGLRVMSGVSLTLSNSKNTWLFGWLENRGALNVSFGSTLKLCGSLYNNGGDQSGAISVGGIIDIYPGKLLKNYGTVTISVSGEETGAVHIGGTLAWGSEAAMPGSGTTPGYSVYLVSGYEGGRIVSTSRTAGSGEEYAALLKDETCDNIILGFDMSVTADTVFEKSVIVPSGRTLAVGSGVTLTVTNGAWLNISGGTLQNAGTIVVAHENDNPGHIAINGGSVLENTNGKIEVYGELRFSDYNNTVISGEDNITYHYYTNLRDLSERLYGLVGSGYGLTAATADEYASTYADWGNLSEEDQLHVAFVLKNMTSTGFLEKTFDANKYLEPYSQLTYGETTAVLEQLWDKVKNNGTDVPESVSLADKTTDSLICTYDYGSGSELENLLGLFLQALGNVEVTDAVTFTVNGGSGEQYMSYKTYTDAVTIIWDSSSGFSASSICFTGCVFTHGITVVNSGHKFWVNLVDCSINGNVAGKDNQIYVLPECDSVTGDPVFNVTNNENEVFLLPRGTTNGISVGVENCAAHVESYVAGGTFTLNGVTYYGASSLGSGGCFAGKYQIDASEGGNTQSFHAGEYTQRVVFGDASFREFHVWDNIQNNVTLELNNAFSSGGNLNISDDYYGDEYGIAVTGIAGDVTEAKELSVYLHGTVDLSGLTVHTTSFTTETDSAVRFASDGAFIHPKVVGDYSTKAVAVGEGNLITGGYTIELYQISRDEFGNETRSIPNNVRVEYKVDDNMTYVYGLPSTDNLELEITHGGVEVCWTSMQRQFDAATQAEFAEALYAKYGSNASFPYNSAASGEYLVGNAADFVINNGLMTQVSGDFVTMHEAVTALSTIANTLEVTFRDYFTDNELARVDYQDGVSYDSEFKVDLLELASAFALGSSFSPYYTDDGEGGQELAIGFDGNRTIGKTKYDPNGNTELSVLLEAFQTACGGGVYIGDSPNIRGAAFAGPVTMTMGGSNWSDVGFINCIFKDAESENEALNLTTDCGANIRFESCNFYGAASGFSLNLSTVTAEKRNANNVNLSNIPDGAKINTENVAFYADCGVGKGSFSINAATITALDFSDYDGEGTTYDNAFFAAGLWWDDGSEVPTLGFSGGIARVTVPESCATKFGAFNAGDDCPYDITLDFNAGWTPDYETGLSLRNWSISHTMYITGAITGGVGTSESDPDYTLLYVELLGSADITSAALTGNHILYTGKWVDANQSHTVGSKNISVFCNDNDSGRHIGISIGNTSGATDSAAVSYHSLGSDDHVTINGIEGISFTEDGRVCVGDLITGAYSSGTTFTGYTLKLYEYQGSGWIEITDYTVDTGTDSLNYRLVPTASFAEPYIVKLSVTDTNTGTGTTFNVVWDLSGSENGEIDVSSESTLSSALGNENINKINIVGDITLSLPEGQSETTYTFSKEVVVKDGATLTVPDGVTLKVNNGLTVEGTLSVAGDVQVYGWINDCGDWDGHIITSGEGQVYTYADFQSFAIDLYNRFSEDYGLNNGAGLTAYESCYAPDYYKAADEAGIRAINFLIENGVISPSATNLNGWVKIPYSGAMGLLDGLARVVEVSLSMGVNSITDYGVNGWTIGENGDDLLCTSGLGGDTIYDSLLDSFCEKVGTISISGAATYSYGLNNNRVSCYKNYASDVTANCAEGGSGIYLFSHCAFGANLTVNCGVSDTVLLINCTISGNLTVRDDDGNTNVYFYDTSFSNPGTSTVTVTDKTGAVDSARLDVDCDSVVLHYLPVGISVINDKVSAAVINRKETGSIIINGVEVTGETYVPGDDDYFVTAVTCWQAVAESVEIPVLVVTGSTEKIDATGDTTNGGDGFAKFWLYENTDNGLTASDTVLVPKSGSAVNIDNSANARFKVSFDGTTVIDPIIYNAGGTAGYVIDVPTDSNITYEIKTVSDPDFIPVTPVDGKISLETGADYTNVSMIVTYTNGTVTTQVGIDTLAYIAGTLASVSFGYVTSAPEIVENDTDEQVYSITFWDGSATVTANTTDVSTAEVLSGLEKNTIITYTFDGSDIDITGVKALSADNVGAVAAYSDGIIQFAYGTAEEDISGDTNVEAVVSPGSVTNLSNITSYTVLMYINRANACGFGDGEIQPADETAGGNYIANCYYIVDANGDVILLVSDVDNDILNVR